MGLAIPRWIAASWSGVPINAACSTDSAINTSGIGAVSAVPIKRLAARMAEGDFSAMSRASVMARASGSSAISVTKPQSKA